jgi:integrase
MAVRKRGNSWIIDYRANGKRYMRVMGPSKRDAIAAEGKIKAQIREGRFFECRRIKETMVGELIGRYLDHFRGKRSLPTEEFHLKAILSFFGGSKPVSQIDRSDVDAFQRARLDTTKRSGAHRSTSTINRELATLRRLLNKAVEWKAIEKNPAAGRKMLPERKGRTRFLSVGEAGRLLDACSSHLYPIVLCALETGMRRGEILSLRWEDVDLEHRILYVGETKTGIPRHVPISSRLANTLLSRARNGASEYLFAGKRGMGGHGKPFHDVRTSFKNACRRAGVAGFRFHDLRHTAASHMVMAGVPVKVVGEILGHTTVSMTERYSHLLPEHKLRAVEMLPDWTGRAPRALPEPRPA